MLSILKKLSFLGIQRLGRPLLDKPSQIEAASISIECKTIKRSPFFSSETEVTATIGSTAPISSVIFSTNLINCESGRNVVCAVDIDLSDFNGQAISFSFNVSDKIRSVNSKISTLFVDTTTPLVTINSPNNISQARRVNFDLGISEVIEDLSYIDFNDRRPSEKRLCRKCQYYNKTRAFTTGNHSVKFIAEDKASNKGEANVNFTVV